MNKKDPKDNGVHLPFSDVNFINKWQDWLAYRKEQRFPAYKPRGLKATFAELVHLSGNNAETACIIIQRSMSNTWRGLFALPKTYNPNGIKQEPISASGLNDAFNKRFANGI